MTALAGRTIIVRRNGVPIAGIRTKSISINATPIDVTNDDDAGVRALLNQPGQIDVDIQASGVLLDPDNNAILSEALEASDRVAPTSFDIVNGSPTKGFSGEFFMGPMTISGEYQGHVAYEFSFHSAGTVTYNAG